MYKGTQNITDRAMLVRLAGVRRGLGGATDLGTPTRVLVQHYDTVVPVYIKCRVMQKKGEGGRGGRRPQSVGGGRPAVISSQHPQLTFSRDALQPPCTHSLTHTTSQKDTHTLSLSLSTNCTSTNKREGGHK